MDALEKLGFKLDRTNAVRVTYRCGHDGGEHQPSGDRDEYRKRIATIDCGSCSRPCPVCCQPWMPGHNPDSCA